MGAPAYFVTVDWRRGLALVKGRNGVTDMLKSLGVHCHGWSPSKRGWVIAAEHVPDVEAFARSRGQYAVVHGERTNPADIAAIAAAEQVLRSAHMLHRVHTPTDEGDRA